MKQKTYKFNRNFDMRIRFYAKEYDLYIKLGLSCKFWFRIWRVEVKFHMIFSLEKLNFLFGDGMFG